MCMCRGVCMHASCVCMYHACVYAVHVYVYMSYASWMDGGMEGGSDGRMDGWTDGRIDGQSSVMPYTGILNFICTFNKSAFRF